MPKVFMPKVFMPKVFEKSPFPPQQKTAFSLCSNFYYFQY